MMIVGAAIALAAGFVLAAFDLTHEGDGPAELAAQQALGKLVLVAVAMASILKMGGFL